MVAELIGRQTGAVITGINEGAVLQQRIMPMARLTLIGIRIQARITQQISRLQGNRACHAVAKQVVASRRERVTTIGAGETEPRFCRKIVFTNSTEPPMLSKAQS